VVMAATATAAAVAAVIFTPAISEDKGGDDERSKCSEVEESGEDSSCHKSPLLALSGPTASGQANDARDEAWNGDPKSFPEIDTMV